jgi:hypothetical protein
MISKMLDYFKRLNTPLLNRDKNKYYPEIQQLAYNLVRYLKMNEDENEHSFQGNHNLTYLIENMTKSDFEFIVTKFLGRIPLNRLNELIKQDFSESSYKLLFEKDKKELETEISKIQEQLDKLKERLNK